MGRSVVVVVRGVLVLALGCWFVGCGDDDDGAAANDAGPTGEAGTGASGKSGSGGAGKAGSAGNSTGMAGSGNAGSSGVGGGAGSGVAGGGSGGSSGTGGTGGTTAPPLECGSETCPAITAQAAMMGVTACCTSDNACGLDTMQTDSCVPMNGPGGTDPSCPSYDVNGFFTWYGCCTPSGQCGAQAGGSLGCIANDNLTAGAAASCTYDPNNDCERLVEVTCDGAEDCGSGQQCCGVYDGGYRKLVCNDDCAAAQTSEGGTWSEICHPGETCTNSAFSCLENTFLPDYLFRCRDTGTAPANTGGSVSSGEINCGDAVCGSGQKCCISVPGEAVCVPSSQDCSCVPEGTDLDAGTEDAGR